MINSCYIDFTISPVFEDRSFIVQLKPEFSAIKRFLSLFIRRFLPLFGFLICVPNYREKGVNPLIVKKLIDFCKGVGMKSVDSIVIEYNETTIKA